MSWVEVLKGRALNMSPLGPYGLASVSPLPVALRVFRKMWSPAELGLLFTTLEDLTEIRGSGMGAWRVKMPAPPGVTILFWGVG